MDPQNGPIDFKLVPEPRLPQAGEVLHLTRFGKSSEFRSSEGEPLSELPTGLVLKLVNPSNKLRRRLGYGADESITVIVWKHGSIVNQAPNSGREVKLISAKISNLNPERCGLYKVLSVPQ